MQMYIYLCYLAILELNVLYSSQIVQLKERNCRIFMKLCGLNPKFNASDSRMS